MTDRFFKFSSTINRLRQGPLGSHIDGFATVLWEQGFSPVWARIQIRFVGDFNRWLDRERIGAQEVNEQVVARYLRHRGQVKPLPPGRAFTLTRLLRMLKEKGITSATQRPIVLSPREAAIDAFRRYLLEERGLSKATLRNMSCFIDQFLAEQFPDDRFEFASLSPRDVTRFVQRQAAELSSGRAKLLVTALRGYFRYLLHQGEIDCDLAACVPSVPHWSLSTLPRFLPPGTVEKVLNRCDRSTAHGRRDYAVLVLLSRLGLRSGEVVALTLDDLDWDLGQITIRGKGSRWSKLPLPADVGEAIAEYLRQDRPRCSTRSLFVTRMAPVAGFGSHTPIVQTVQKALKRAGVDPAGKTPHSFRHTLATEMLQRGASLGEIGDVLRHRSANTTRIYAKVDLHALRKLALAWPGGAR